MFSLVQRPEEVYASFMESVESAFLRRTLLKEISLQSTIPVAGG